MFYVFVLTLLSQVPIVMTHEPRSASPLTQSVSANCGRTPLLISGYGVARPLGRTPRFLVNGRPIAGQAAAQILHDLSNRRAVYRFEILCGDPGEVTVRINMGERQVGGPVRYQIGSVVIRGNRLFSYRGLEESNEDRFWFR
jgi:hypothetical protein